MSCLPAGILEQTPEAMARRSLPVKEAHGFLSGQIAGMKNGPVREKLLSMFERPQSCLPEQISAQKALFRRLREQGLINADLTFREFIPGSTTPLPVWAASGSHYRGHNAYPGGLAVHTENNLRLALAASETYETMYGLPIDRDMLIFAQTAHDLAKAWLLPWQEDGACPPQYHIAGGGAHHAFGLAESIRRGLPPSFIFAQAAAHADPCTESGCSDVCGFLRAACLIADVDPIHYGFWDKRHKLELDCTQQEYWFSYMADHTVIFTLRATRRAIKLLKKLAADSYGLSPLELEGKPFNQLRNYLFCQLGTAGVMRLATAPALLVGEVTRILAMADE